MDTSTTARAGEEIAARWARERGWRIIERNWRCRSGEIDLVALDGTEVVVIEVKTRTSTRHGHPSEAVTREKVARLRRLAGQWLASHEVGTSRVRLDVVAILWPKGDEPRLLHLQGVG